jgi:hypothetical protein
MRTLIVDFFTIVPGAAFLGGIFDFYARRYARLRI